jgi:flagellar basal body-associated protein FliL
MSAADHNDGKGDASAPKPTGSPRTKPEFYDTQFIVNRLQTEQRRSRLKAVAIVVILGVVAVAVFALTSRRVEAPAPVQAPEVAVPKPQSAKPLVPPKPKPAVPPIK